MVKITRLNLLLAIMAVLALTLVACGADEPTPVATDAESAAVAVAATSEPTRPVLPTPTSPPPTQTAAPTSTSLPDASPTPLPTAVPTVTPIPSKPVDSITLTAVVEGVFSRPLYVTHANDERLFVVEQPGRIRIVANGQLESRPFLDISDRIASSQLEQGLLGLAFHPDYAATGYFFVNYTDLSGNTQIARFSVSAEDPNLADPGSELILLSLNQPYPNHNGGQVAFGPDGYLYVGVGDGGSANDPLNSGQDPSTLLGTLLRLDVDSVADQLAIPGDNPFVDNDERRNEVWAWGLRNPWRFSFDRLTGDLYTADVGQNLWEEINFQPAQSRGGENYGWNVMEANHCFLNETCDATEFVPPIFEYDHGQGCSVTGGYVYRGQDEPALYGNYLLGDFCQGTIWRLFPNGDGSFSAAVVLDTNYVISSFGEDARGELYLTDHTSGSLYRIGS